MVNVFVELVVVVVGYVVGVIVGDFVGGVVECVLDGWCVCCWVLFMVLGRGMVVIVCFLFVSVLVWC